MPEYRTPGVYVEEIASGPRPVQASSTTETGFVGIIALPDAFHKVTTDELTYLVPGPDDDVEQSWSRVRAYRALLGAADAATSTGTPGEGGAIDAAREGKKGGAGRQDRSGARDDSGGLQRLVRELLSNDWRVSTPSQGASALVLRSGAGELIRVPIRRTMLVSGADAQWHLAFGAEEEQLVELLATQAIAAGVKHSGLLGSIGSHGAAEKPVTLTVSRLQSQLHGAAKIIHSQDAFEQWRWELSRDLFCEIATICGFAKTTQLAEAIWMDERSATWRDAWCRWIRLNPGMRRLELALRGFFENGGRTAHVAVGVQGRATSIESKSRFLQDAFDGISNVAMVCAPGLDRTWQQAILEYSGPRSGGRGDLFAILEAPRYLMTRPPPEQAIGPTRWSVAEGPYEVHTLQVEPTAQSMELRNAEYAKDEVLLNCIPRDDTGHGAAYGPWLVVENPVSTGPHDRYVIAPPSGHIAGAIASTDLKPGGGVHKAPANEQLLGVVDLVTSVSDREQETLNVRGINVIRHRPGAGIRIWGARTVARDPLWTYVNVRRLFLFVERSVRDNIQWAVFLPNSDQSRSDLRATILAFLNRLYAQGMLDGRTWQEAYSVRCDRANNPDEDVRSGVLTVDVEIRPVYPAEFIRVRFRQSPMISEVLEA